MDQVVINNIKTLGLDMIDNAGSGHPGIVLGAAPIIYTVFNNHLNVFPSDDKWLNRDRFVLSAGHGSALLYATLYMAGYDLSLDDLKKFRQIGSKTPGHPEFNLTSGVEATTGPLGQGIANAVGMAIGQKLLNKKNNIFNYKIYVLCSDGDLMEGISNEAASLAGNLKLDNLILLYDSNDVSLDGKLDLSFKEDVLERFKAMGWHTDFIMDGNDISAIDSAINRAKKANLPSIIEIKTIIGEGSKYEDTNIVHGKPLDKDDLNNIKTSLGVQNTSFYVDAKAKEYFTTNIINRTKEKYEDFKNNYITKEYPKIELDRLSLELNEADEMRNINNKIMNYIAHQLDYFISGSADLSTSCKTHLKDKDIFDGTNYGQNIFYGVREHAMGAISNGLALTNFSPVASTFLIFSDYLKPALRLSVIMDLPVTYLFTHDSINIGSDGATHQPIEQLAMLRATPNLNVIRPADANELIGAWKYILEHKKPSALVVSKIKVDKIATSNLDISSGGYIISPEKQVLHGIIIATGTEVHSALKVQQELYEKEKVDLRVISMPSLDLFLKTNKEYQELTIPKGYRTVVIEAASSYGWHRFVYNDNYLITLDSFGKSGTGSDVLKAMNFDYDSIYLRVKKLFK
jgi:transketolase